MRGVALFGAGVLFGVALQPATTPPNGIVGLNHVSIRVENFDQAVAFYSKTLGLKEAFAFREPDGSPYMTYFQVNRDTFIELMPVGPGKPAGFAHIGLQVSDVKALAARLRQQGMKVGEPSISPRTKSEIVTATDPFGTNMELMEFGPNSLHYKVIHDWKH